MLRNLGSFLYNSNMIRHISSREWEAEDAAKCIQGHWMIENNLHWTHLSMKMSPRFIRGILRRTFQS